MKQGFCCEIDIQKAKKSAVAGQKDSFPETYSDTCFRSIRKFSHDSTEAEFSFRFSKFSDQLS